MEKENPRYREKVSYIRGDIQLPNLNISDEDTEKLLKTVNIIFHAAATVNFHQKLRVAVDINVHGIKRIVELSKKMYNLKVNYIIQNFVLQINQNLQRKYFDEYKIYCHIPHLLGCA